MHLMEAILVFIPRILPARMADGAVLIAPLAQACIVVVFVGVTWVPGSIVARISGSMVACWTFSKEPKTNNLYGLRRIFVCLQGAERGVSPSYVTLSATQQAGGKTSKMVTLLREIA
jgi:hypothetical protein